MSTFSEFCLAMLLSIGVGVVGGFVLIGLIQIITWVVKGAVWAYYKVTGKTKPVKPKREVYKPKTWSEGWTERGELSDRTIAHYQKMLDNQRAETERWFRSYMQVRFPNSETHTVTEPESTGIPEPVLTDAVLDTDE